MPALSSSSPLRALGLRTDGDLARIEILDQTLLPGTEAWCEASTPARMVEHIRLLRVRGAPMIGVCAALSLAASARAGSSTDELRAQARMLRLARPTAVNLAGAIDRLMAAVEAQGPGAAAELARRLFHEERLRCDQMAAHGAPLLPLGARVLTHCNTGALATPGVGTALGVLKRAFQEGRLSSVWVDETRPLLQGARLTTWELQQAGIPHRLICEATAASVMADRQVDAIVVGADRIAANGDIANKIGTYALAVLAWAHGLPFYVVAPHSTVDPDCPDGGSIPIEERGPEELRGPLHGAPGAPADTPVYNPAFDRTPARLVSAWILDTGVLRQDAVQRGALRRAGPPDGGPALG